MQNIDSLVIGKNAQLAHYLENKNIVKVSARNFDMSLLNKSWDKIYLLFAEQRTYYANNKNYKQEFYDVNYYLTKKIVDNASCNKIVYLSTTELWNNVSGPITINTAHDFIQNYYTDSKMMITNYIKKNFNPEDAIILYPYNFNSTYRKSGFLFYKIFDSIINNKKIELGHIDINRELMHAKYVSSFVQKNKKSEIIGTGKLTNVQKFIHDLYDAFNMVFEDYVLYNNTFDTKKNINWKKTDNQDYKYSCLLHDTIQDLNNKKSKNE